MPTSSVVILPAEVRVQHNIKKALEESNLVSAGTDLLGLCLKSFIAERTGDSSGMKRFFVSLLKASAFEEARQELGLGVDEQHQELRKVASRHQHKMFGEFRKILGTQVLKTAETKGLVRPVRRAVSELKKFEIKFGRTGRGSDEMNTTKRALVTLLGSEIKSMSQQVNSYATLVAERVVLDALITSFFGHETARLVTDVEGIYEELYNRKGFKLGYQAWHNPLYTVTNTKRVFDLGLAEFKDEIEFKSSFLRIARFLQGLGDRESDGLSSLQLTGLFGEHKLVDEDWYRGLEPGLREREAVFTRLLSFSAHREERQAKELLYEALSFDHPFKAMGTIDNCLSSKRSAQISLRAYSEMSEQPELEFNENSQESFVFVRKESDAIKRAQQIEEVLKSASTVAVQLFGTDLSRQAEQMLEYAGRIEREMSSRSLDNNDLVDFSDTVPTFASRGQGGSDEKH